MIHCPLQAEDQAQCDISLLLTEKLYKQHMNEM